MAEKIYDCGYLVPKSLLIPTSQQQDEHPPTNRAVVNSVGGINCADPADYVACRDNDPLFPDSAVMMKELHLKEIEDTAKEVVRELFPSSIEQQGASSTTTNKKYIAVQHKTVQKRKEKKTFQDLATSLDAVSKHSNATIVFFAAGTAAGHDSFDMCKKVASLMKEPSVVYEAENVWNVVAVTSQAEAVLSTSLHVRIMAFLFFKPRVAWCTEPKHARFIELWDAKDAPQCLKTLNQTWSVLSDCCGSDPKITQDKTKVVCNETVKKCLESFDKWSSLLQSPPKRQVESSW
jgi:polysaccharide pyruvyl transferase WcaK-like protein